MLAVLALAGCTRFIGLGEPDQHYFDESFYAVDACGYVLSPAACDLDHPRAEASWVHPPMGKWLIGSGISIAGYRPAGWRLASAIAGVSTVGLLFVLGRSLTSSLAGAVVPSGLLALDFLHLVHSRMAMLDVFLTLFLVAAVLCLQLDRSRHHPGRMLPPWRLATGACLGLAMATKWTAAGAIVAVAAITVAAERQRLGDITTHPWRGALAKQWLPMAVAYCLVPLGVYALTFLGRLEATFLALPWEPESWARAFLGRQRQMLSADLSYGDSIHPYTSQAWSWPLLKRPVSYFFETTDDGQVRHVLGIGSPLVWWTTFAVIGASAWTALRRRGGDAERVALVVIALLYLPLVALNLRRSFTFLYYLLPVVPFAYLLVAPTFARWHRRAKVAATTSLAILATTSFAFFAPVLYAVPVTYDGWRARIVFESCAEAVGRLEVDGRVREIPARGWVPPPSGWCWI